MNCNRAIFSRGPTNRRPNVQQPRLDQQCARALWLHIQMLFGIGPEQFEGYCGSPLVILESSRPLTSPLNKSQRPTTRGGEGYRRICDLG